MPHWTNKERANERELCPMLYELIYSMKYSMLLFFNASNEGTLFKIKARAKTH